MNKLNEENLSKINEYQNEIKEINKISIEHII